MEIVENAPFMTLPSWSERPTLRLILKQLADGLLAGAAWLIADQLWFATEWNIRKMLVWILIATAVEKVAINFGKPDQKWLDRMTLAEAKQYS